MYDYYDNDDSYVEQDDNILEAGNDESQGCDNDDTSNDDSDNVVEAQGNDDNVVEAQGNDNVVESQGDTTPHISILGHQISFMAAMAGFDCYCTGGCLCKRYAPKSTFDTDCFYCGHHLSDHTKR